MKRVGALFMMCFLALGVGNANASLIGVNLSLPDIFSNSTGTYSYDAVTQVFTASATTHTITFDGITSYNVIDGTYQLQVMIDNSGNFIGGVAGDDLTITGAVDIDGDTVADYSGTLVSGNVQQFGWDTLASYFYFDFYFVSNPTDALAAFYAQENYLGADFSSAESTTFTGSWDMNHSGDKVKHDTSPIPEPATLILLGSGLAGFAMMRRRQS